MFCKQCGSELQEGANHCTSCGAAVNQTEASSDPFAGPTPEAPPVPDMTSATTEEPIPEVNLNQEDATSSKAESNYGSQSVYTSPVSVPRIEERNIGLAIVLTLITCGIYGIYWQYKVFEESRIISGTTDDGSAGMDIVLSIITCGIYLFYAVYKSGQRIYQAQVAQGENATDDSIMLTILLVFIQIVSFALLQSKLNDYAKKYC